MKKTNKVIVFMILIAISLMPIKASAEGLKDLETSEFKLEIQKLIEDGVIHGYPDDTFRPEASITRGEFAKILATALNLEEDIERASHFTDVKGKWSQGYIGALYKVNLMVGKSKDIFGHADNVTRQEMAVILTRVYGLEEEANKLALEPEFHDKDNIADWAKKSVVFTYKIELIKGIENEDGTVSFEPTSKANRQLVSKLVYELRYNKEYYMENIDKLLKELDIDNKDKEQNEEEVEQLEKDPSKKPEKDESKDKVDNKPSYDSIVSRYQDEMMSLQSSVTAELSSLVSQAKSEYLNSTTPASEIISKYMGLASSLESSADSGVSSILSSLSSELSSYGYDTSITEDLQSQYEATKQSIADGMGI